MQPSCEQKRYHELCSARLRRAASRQHWPRPERPRMSKCTQTLGRRELEGDLNAAERLGVTERRGTAAAALILSSASL
eukprot:1815532-Pleurochrysis_carterae.AAC.6